MNYEVLVRSVQSVNSARTTMYLFFQYRIFNKAETRCRALQETCRLLLLFHSIWKKKKKAGLIYHKQKAQKIQRLPTFNHYYKILRVQKFWEKYQVPLLFDTPRSLVPRGGLTGPRAEPCSAGAGTLQMQGPASSSNQHQSNKTQTLQHAWPYFF